MKASSHVCDVKSCFLCSACLPDWLPAIAAQKINFEVKKGQAIFSEGDPVSGIYFVYRGVVKVQKRWDNEKELIIRFAGPGDILGHLGLGDEPFYPVSTVALEPAIICYLPLNFFESTLKVNNEFTLKLLRFFANELQESERRMRNLAHMSVKGRIAQAIIALKNKFGVNGVGQIGISLSRQDMASYAGVSYETLFKVTNEFTSANLVNLVGRSTFIRNEPALLKIVEDESR